MLKCVSAAGLLAPIASPALAQTSLDQSLTDVVRGLESQNTSGQGGEVMLHENSLTVDIKGASGKPEALTINRSFECSRDRLLAGNYVVVVHNNGPMSQPVACGQLNR